MSCEVLDGSDEEIVVQRPIPNWFVVSIKIKLDVWSELFQVFRKWTFAVSFAIPVAQIPRHTGKTSGTSMRIDTVQVFLLKKSCSQVSHGQQVKYDNIRNFMIISNVIIDERMQGFEIFLMSFGCYVGEARN